MFATGQFALRPSSILLALLLFAALLLCALLFVLPVAPVWSIAGGVCVLAACAWAIWRDAILRADASCVAFRIEPKGRIVLSQRNGEQPAGKVRTDSLVTPILVLLNIATEHGRQRSLVLLPDSMAGDDFRRLRVLLRWSGNDQA